MTNLTGRPIYQKNQSAPKKAPKPMRKVSAKRSKARASKDGRDAIAYMGKVANLPCVICYTHKLPQLSPTQVHHCIHERYSAAKRSDWEVIPLCEGHHQGLMDTSKTALHNEPYKWKKLYGADTDLIEWTQKRATTRGNKAIVKGECRVEGCDLVVLAGNYCSTHYRRFLKFDDPEHGKPVGGPIKWIMENSTHTGSACLEWPFSDQQGYYSLALGKGKYTKAHRYMCIQAHGVPDDNLQAAHSCGNKSCVNPAHLRWATASENMQDRKVHGTNNEGEKCHNSRLTEVEVREIRERYANGESIARIHSDYKHVKNGNIWAVVHRKTWRHVQ